MARLFIILSLCLFFFSCREESNTVEKEEVKIDLRRQKSDSNPLRVFFRMDRCISGENDANATYAGAICIYNQTDSVVLFNVRNCSYYDNFVFSNSAISIPAFDCDANFMKPVFLEPSSMYCIDTYIQVKSKKQVGDINNIRIGFLYYGRDYFAARFNYRERAKINPKIIWSREPLAFE